jgi:hypothetical protein
MNPKSTCFLVTVLLGAAVAAAPLSAQDGVSGYHAALYHLEDVVERYTGADERRVDEAFAALEQAILAVNLASGGETEPWFWQSLERIGQVTNPPAGYPGPTVYQLQEVLIMVEQAIRSVWEHVTVEDSTPEVPDPALIAAIAALDETLAHYATGRDESPPRAALEAILALIEDIVEIGGTDVDVFFWQSRTRIRRLLDSSSPPTVYQLAEVIHAVEFEVDLLRAMLYDRLPPVLPPVVFFRRGDANGDGGVDMADAIFTLDFLFLGGAAPGCEKAADANDDGSVNVSDPTATLAHLFMGDEPPSFTFGAIAPDWTPDDLTCASPSR